MGPESITNAANRGAKWSAGTQVGTQLVQVGTYSVLAVLLGPAAFGLVGMAMVVIGFAGIFNNLGTGAALVQKKELDEDLLCSVFWANCLFGLLAMVVVILTAPWMSRFYNEPELTRILPALAFTFLLSGPGTVGYALLQRELRFERIVIVELIALSVGSVIAISMAFLDFGVWSLVTQALFAAATKSVLTLGSTRWWYRPQIHLQAIREIWSFSANLTGYSIFNYVARQADYLLIGKFLGVTALGHYTLAYKLMLYPMQSLTQVVGRVMFPLFARLQDDDARFRRGYLKTVGLIALFTFPMMAGMFIVAAPLIDSVFGPAWAPATTCLMILAPVGLVQSIGSTVGPIYQAKGRTDWMFRWGVGSGLLCVAGMAIGLQFGIAGVACGYAAVTFLIAYLNFAIPFALIELPVSALGEQLKKPFYCAMVMLAAVTFARWGTSNVDPLIQLSISVVVGVATYTAISYVSNRDTILQLRQLASTGASGH